MKNSRCTVPHSLPKECKLMFLVSRQHLPLSSPLNTDVFPDGGVTLTHKCSHGKTSWVRPITTGTGSSKRAESWRGNSFRWAEQGTAWGSQRPLGLHPSSDALWCCASCNAQVFIAFRTRQQIRQRIWETLVPYISTSMLDTLYPPHPHLTEAPQCPFGFQPVSAFKQGWFFCFCQGHICVTLELSLLIVPGLQPVPKV